MRDASGYEPVYPVTNYSETQYPGLSKRELFAAMAMQGLASVPSQGGVTDAGIAHDVGAAVAYADALIAALAKDGA